jgi:predicted nucleic acid-binding protein
MISSGRRWGSHRRQALALIGLDSHPMPNDNAFLALAIDAASDAIVTGDHDLLAVHPHGAIAILTPRTFLEQWGTESLP